MNVIDVATNAKNGTTQVYKNAATSKLKADAKAAAKAALKAIVIDTNKATKCKMQAALKNPAIFAMNTYSRRGSSGGRERHTDTASCRKDKRATRSIAQELRKQTSASSSSK